MNKEINHIGHIGLFTNKPQRLFNFYTRKIGFKQEKQTIIPAKTMKKIFGIACDCRLINLINNNAKIEIFSFNFPFLNKRLNKQIGYNHYSLIVRDKTKFCEKLSRKGVSIIKVERNTRIVYFIKDPDGNRIEIQDYLPC